MRTQLIVMAGLMALAIGPRPVAAQAELDAAQPATLVLLRQSRFTAGAVHTGFWVNGEFVGAMKKGRMEVTLAPGAHRVEASSALPCDALFAPDDCELNPFPGEKMLFDLELAAGERKLVEVYMTLETASGIEYRTHGQWPAWSHEVPEVTPQVGFISTAFATDAERAAIEFCEATRTREACNAYLQDYPGGSFLGRAEVVISELDAEQARRRAALAAIPPEARRDALMVRIGDALAAGEPAAALPHFEELSQLPVELDANTDFYWGRTLIEADRAAEGLEKLYRYVLEHGREAPQYRAALELMNRMERGL